MSYLLSGKTKSKLLINCGAILLSMASIFSPLVLKAGPNPSTVKAEPNPSVPNSNIGRLKVLSWTPRIFLLENFLSDAECDHLIAQGRSQLVRSTVVDENSPVGKLHYARTSEGMFFPQHSDDPILQNIENRIAAVTMLPVENGEGVQMLRYGIGGEYQPHYDYFDNVTEGGKYCYNRGGQRVASLIMYLHTTEEGGETIFPKANISVKPVKRNAVLFYNCLPDGTEDPLSFHGGAPVIKGEKWIATKWIRKGEFK